MIISTRTNPDFWNWGRVPIIQGDNAVSGLVGSFVVFRGGSHERKTHKEFSTTHRDSLSGALSSLFSNVGLLLEVDRTEGIIFEDRGCANNVVRENVKLVFAGGAKP